jgi:DNA modification methylase
MIIHGNCLDKLKDLPDNSVDSVVTDPPYELGFMGKSWDGSGIANNPEMWREVLRVLKPGGHLLSFGGDRTHHRMTAAIEDAGFEIRTTIVWTFGSGFPKSLNVSKKLNSIIPSILRCVCADHSTHIASGSQSDCLPSDDLCDAQPLSCQDTDQDVSPLQDDAQKHSHADCNEDGQVEESKRNRGYLRYDPLSNEDCQRLYQHLLKDSQESDSKLSDILTNMLHDELMVEHKMAHHKSGTQHSDDDLVYSCSSVDSISRIYHKCNKCGGYFATNGIGTALKPAAEFITMARKPIEGTVANNVLKYGTGGLNIDKSRVGTEQITQRLATVDGGKAIGGKGVGIKQKATGETTTTQGRFPANLLHDGSDEVVREFPNTKGDSRTSKSTYDKGIWGNAKPVESTALYSDDGSAARYFKSFIYCPKASKSERDRGCEGMEEKTMGRNQSSLDGGKILTGSGNERSNTSKNHHPTVKPLTLMKYLIQMITPEGGVVLDPFAGSGSTLVAAKELGYDFIGIEMTEEYIPIIEARLNAVRERLL